MFFGETAKAEPPPFLLVRGRGFEPPRPKAFPPQGSASTNFATRAFLEPNYYI